MNHPDAPELLAAARETLMNEVFPSVPESLRYEMRMIASAMGIAAREAKQGEHVRKDEIALLSGLLPESEAVASGTQEEARRALAKAIRSGAFDAPEQQQRLQSSLQQAVSNALMISNPKVARATGGTN
ncbi:DUF6285 domain-containing protein [Marinobacter sp.]|uniref:DUF6285 domain-containing protein n=1 Tax=Marinobacter sp. TaxID=50741 RepID=UPI003569A731